MRASKRRNRQRKHTSNPTTWGETWERCPFRSFIGLGQHPGDANEMGDRIGHIFAALGGEPAPIADSLMAEMIDSIRRGRTVLVISNRADLRDQAKREILAQVHGAAGTA